MSMKTSDFFVKRLKEWGVTRIYGYPGDGINGVLGAIQRANKAGDGIEFIQVRHEEMAAFMAVGHAKFTGELGVCLSTGGPGATHLLTGLYDAKMDHAPVLAISGQAESTARGASYQQEMNLDRVFADVANFVQEAASPAQVRHLVDRGVRIAIAQNGVGVVILPKDIQDEEWQPPAHTHGFTHSAAGYQRPRVIPHNRDLQRAAEVLNAGKKVAILIGAGARNAAVEVVQTANVLGAGVAKALLGKDVLPDDAPFVTGSIGLLGTEPSWKLMQQCDTLLMIGSGFPWTEFLPPEGQARAVQIDIDPAMLGLRYPCEVALHGDAAETLQALLPLLTHKEDRSWQEEIARQVQTWWQVMEQRAMAPARPVNPQRVVWEMSPLLPENAIVTSDSGSCANWFARDYRVKQGQRASLSGGLACMGAAVPYAIAAKFAAPEKPVVALVGDGAMQMNNMAELITVQKYWQQWQDPRLIICVFNNQDLNQVTWEQRVMEGNPRFEATQQVPDVRYAEFARSLGLQGIFVDTPEALRAAWLQALQADRPVLLEVKTDPEVAPLPPHITLKQAKAFMASMMKGDRGAVQVLSDTASQLFHKKS
ncbi:UNVERIFIED_ORG: pyruvate dehydrogenase (quinone) [Kosakonia oryzae]|uniref:Pyruvate dehydrogenase (Quinone) n=1 Tax=Kosakonia radicincitans TaxID=283686 RepID=A0AAX2ENY6_9ENTR|nr:thiamine pyrophosphate-requiring protein [Kosakonia radicincitans]MDP9566996.1 pyruvate dehydrogenase (quinone) [Kosakonia oryzae]SFE75551.1 pyruvate dehydrogenase (quinone) [Kosakonia radicincitans]SFR03919.1 pyruvate dehydrogenase (quinone) [Kosakonia radicincitans]SFT57311.1 pyruvate dehydrogenase (quinone) [Kosakonia radicincitans]SFX32850.1 pyruvate dehydrogenase (quinone) [Kosakonia radicincitans]